MKTLVKNSASDLKSIVSTWIDRAFNNIPLGLLEDSLKADNQSLIEYIDPMPLATQEYFYNLDESEKREIAGEYINHDTISELSEDNPLFITMVEELIENPFPFTKIPNGLIEFLESEYEDEIREYTDESEENYPMWGTIFETKYNEGDEFYELAKAAGFGVINETDHLNKCLFVSGCGYSFYSAHWIPLFLSLPYNKDMRERFKGVDYQGM